jgi:hypothetical protein
MRVFRNTASGAALAFTAAAALFAATPAAAQTYPIAPRAEEPFTYTTLYFTAPCSDCTDAIGILKIANYVTGELMGNSHFVDFRYTSSKLDFEITAADLIKFRAVFTNVPGENFVQIEGPPPPLDPSLFYQFPPFRLFETDVAYTNPSSGLSQTASWSERLGFQDTELPAGANGDVSPDDFGTHFTWSTVDPRGEAAPAPEPAGWVLMIAGFGLTGAALRASRRSSPAASI